MTTLIKNGTVVTAGDTFKADVRIEDEKVTVMGQNLTANGQDEVIDAEGLLLLPGGIDVHTHLELPFGGTVSSDDFFTGHRAAAFGGTTAHIDFAIQPIGGTDSFWHKFRCRSPGSTAFNTYFHIPRIPIHI